jgi:hypothetical protein
MNTHQRKSTGNILGLEKNASGGKFSTLRYYVSDPQQAKRPSSRRYLAQRNPCLAPMVLLSLLAALNRTTNTLMNMDANRLIILDDAAVHLAKRTAKHRPLSWLWVSVRASVDWYKKWLHHDNGGFRVLEQSVTVLDARCDLISRRPTGSADGGELLLYCPLTAITLRTRPKNASASRSSRPANESHQSMITSRAAFRSMSTTS